MDMEGSRHLIVGQQEAWDALNDPEMLKKCVPGCKSIEANGENAYKFATGLTVGPVSALFKGNITLGDIEAPNSYTINFDGNGGAAGFGNGHAKVRLLANPEEQGCELSYTAHATVGGRMAQVGQRLVDGVAKQMLETFFKRFNDEMIERHPELAPEKPRTASWTYWIWIIAALIAIAWILWYIFSGGFAPSVGY